MKKFGYYALATVAALAMAPAAHAAQFLTISGQSGVYGDDAVTGTFERVFTFGPLPGFILASLDVSSINTSGTNNVDFTSVTFNGVEFNTVLTGTQEFRNLLNQPLLASNTIRVRGVAGPDGAFSGTIALAPIPEPATWAMMIGGFGLIGGAMRRRAKVTVAYA